MEISKSEPISPPQHPKEKDLLDILASALEYGNYAHGKDRGGDKEGSLKYYVKCTELIREAFDLDYNVTRKALLGSLAKSFEELGRGRPSRKRANPYTGEELPILHAGGKGVVKDDKAQNNATANGIQETEIDQKISFHDIAGHELAKRILKEAVILPQKFPQLFIGKRKPWKALLLYGPPGTGKTQLAKAVASESGAKFFAISSADVMSSLVGGSEKKIRDFFTEIRKSPSQVIVFIDEIDSLCRKRSESEDEHIRRVKTELLRQIDGVQTQNANYFLLAATNCPWEIDPAFLRRFQKRIYIGLPGLEEREALFQLHLTGLRHTIKPEELRQIANETEGFSGSDISSIVSDTLMEPVRDLERARFFRKVGDVMMPCNQEHPSCQQVAALTDLPAGSLHQNALRPLTLQDVISSVKRTQKTNAAKDLQAYDKFQRQ